MAKPPYKIVFRQSGTQWVHHRRRKSLGAALCAARRMTDQRGVTGIQVIDGRNGKTWFIGPRQ